MRASPRRRHVGRTARLESIESRLLLSADLSAVLALESLVAESSAPIIMATQAEADSFGGLANARESYGFDGTGQTVVVIDTGIAYQHAALGGGLGTGYQVVGGYDFAERDDDPYDDGPFGAHGTHVAGIIGSQDVSQSGVAPGVDLVSLRVFDDSGKGSYQWVEEALQWVHTHLNSFANPITTVNLSLGSDWNAETQPGWSTIEDELAILESDGVFIAVAAGNSFSTYQTPGLSYPAASSHVVPVMSVDADGSLSYYSQRHSRAIAAPGRSVLSTVPDYVGNRNGVDDDFARFSGTSMAAPYVAATSVLLREAYEFVGIHNVTQATLYELMRNTADVIYDAATSQDYLRLNVQRALDTIMPADDFGSSVETAYQLGTIGGARSISGAAAQLGDHDFFTFTADQSGRVTFSLDATSTMETHWDVVAGGTVRESQGNTVSLDVVAGQTYTVGVGTADGLGHYTLNVQLEAAPSVPNESGARQEVWLDNRLDVDGQWFVFTAGQQGTVTFEALFASWRGDVDLDLYDANGQFLAGSYSTNDCERIDVTASAGQTFYLHAYVYGWEANDDVDVRITNLVSQVGDTVSVFGTQGDDEFRFEAGSTHSLTINGVGYSFNGTSVGHVRFDGFAGADTATLHGTAGTETAVLRAGSAEMQGPGYAVQAVHVENVTAVGGGGIDEASLYDSVANDTFTARPFEATLSGSGFSSCVLGFERITGEATGGGVDVANLYDSSGNDTLRGSQAYARLQGRDFVVLARSFEQVFARATAGGQDVAILYASAGTNLLVGKAAENTLSSSGYQIQVESFDEVYACAGRVGTANALDSSSLGASKTSGGIASIANAPYAALTYGFESLWGEGRGPERREAIAVDYVLDLNSVWE